MGTSKLYIAGPEEKPAVTSIFSSQWNSNAKIFPFYGILILFMMHTQFEVLNKLWEFLLTIHQSNAAEQVLWYQSHIPLNSNVDILSVNLAISVSLRAQLSLSATVKYSINGVMSSLTLHSVFRSPWANLHMHESWSAFKPYPNMT